MMSPVSGSSRASDGWSSIFSPSAAKYSQLGLPVAGSKITTRPGLLKSATMTCLPSTVGKASDG